MRALFVCSLVVLLCGVRAAPDNPFFNLQHDALRAIQSKTPCPSQHSLMLSSKDLLVKLLPGFLEQCSMQTDDPTFKFLVNKLPEDGPNEAEFSRHEAGAQCSAEAYVSAAYLYFRWQIFRGNEHEKVLLLRKILKNFPLVIRLVWPLLDSDLLEKGFNECSNGSTSVLVENLLGLMGKEEAFCEVPDPPTLPAEIRKDLNGVCEEMPSSRGHLYVPEFLESKFHAFAGNQEFASRLVRTSATIKTKLDVSTLIKLALVGIRFPCDEFLKNVQVSTDDLPEMLPFLDFNCENILGVLTADSMKVVLPCPLFVERVKMSPERYSNALESILYSEPGSPLQPYSPEMAKFLETLYVACWTETDGLMEFTEVE